VSFLGGPNNYIGYLDP